MKSKMKRRMLAIVLCMVIVLSNSSFIFASSGTEEPAAVAQEGDPQNVQEAQTEAAVQDTPAVLSETTPEATPEATPEPTQVPEVTAAPTEAPQATAEPTQAPEVTAAPETTPEATPVPTEAPAVTVEPTQAPEVTAAPETTPEATPVPTEAPVTYNEAVELRHEFKDENGNVTATVTAQIPAGAFQADVSELTMEVTVPDQATTEHVKKLMEESLPEHYMLGNTVLYDIRFKVNGTETESQQPIVITFENQNGITVKDVKKAVVFQLDPADPAVEGDKDELVTITQRNDMIESLQNSGQSTDNVDDYDLSEITLKEDGTSNKIQMEGRTSTIYGCYAYYEPVQVLTYEDDQVTVTVSAAENGVIPANAELKVVPITEDKETEDQYKDVEKKLQEKAEEEEYEIAGFLAYDITFVDPDGNETEPNGEVKVSIDYKEAAIPESISEEDAQNAEVSVLHLEEDEDGNVAQVVDMNEAGQLDVVETDGSQQVQKIEMRTESFSAYTIYWYSFNRNIHEPVKAKTEPVNFYLNLTSQILDTSGNITGQDVGDFTTSVSGDQSGKQEGQGIGVPIHEDLRVIVPDDHVHSDGVLGVIGGTSDTNAREVDQLIRKLGEKGGTTGNQTGQTDKTYQIVNEEGAAYFPTDEEIFEYIKTNWSTVDGKGVNKGKAIEVNGEPIDKDKLTTDNFTIRWYVFKDQKEDCWHIDGILVPRSGVLNLTKTFENQEIASALQSQGFSISVIGNFLGTSETTTITKYLNEAEKTVNDDGTVTYSWSLAIFGTEYTVCENNYSGTGDWKYSSTEYTYTDIEGKSTTGNKTTVKITTDCQFQDETPKVQTLAFTNYYTSGNEDELPYIIVKKTFKGLSKAQINTLSQTFELVVNKEGKVVKSLQLSDGTCTPESSDSNLIQDYTYTWKVEDCDTGTYTVTENGAEVGKYTVSTEGTDEGVNVSAASWEFDANVTTITHNSTAEFTIGDNKIVMASLTANQGYMIWTNEQLSSSQKAAIITTINEDPKYSTFNTGDATIDNCHFYSGNALAEGIAIGKGVITYLPPTDGSGKGKLIFDNKNVWQHVLAGDYTITNAQNADISVINTYAASLDLKKVSQNGTDAIAGAKFELARKQEDTTFKIINASFEVENGSDKIELKDLTPGVVYRLAEKEAPTSHILLSEPIYFIAKDGAISLCDVSGNSVTNNQNDMWWLDSDGDVLTIKNNMLYDLPSAGGSGIFWYLISGTAFLMTASLILYRMKRKEVLGK